MLTSSPDSQGSLWPPEPTASAPSPCANQTPAAAPSSPKRGRASHAGQTCEFSTWKTPHGMDTEKYDHNHGPTGNELGNQLNTAMASGSSPLASLVSLPHGPGSSEARQMTAGSGRRLSRFLETSSPLGRFSKILLASETWTSPEFYLRWKYTVTRQGCSVFQLAPLAPRTDANDTGLWPTVTQALAEKSVRTPGGARRECETNAGPDLGAALAIWPTLHGMDNEGNPRRNGPTGNELGYALNHATWPTPDSSEAGKTSRSGERKDEPLIGGLVRSWPTPKAAEGGPDYAIADREGSGGISLPTALGTPVSGCLARTEKFVVRLATLSSWLMGYTAQYLRHWETASSRKSQSGSSPP
jgi:hypothetical protein